MAHAALCTILETGVVDVEPFVVSPVVDGDSLDVALREYGPANMADAIPRLRALADALDAAAALDVSHGSLHLRDIVVSVEATVLTGIGIAAVLERVGVRPPVRRPYCAPEVALGRGISPAADQYSLAAIAHEWLSGRRVSGSEGVHVPTFSPEGAQSLAMVFGRALSAEADARYPSATAFVEALADVSDLVAPRMRASRRKAPPAAPLLEFESAEEAPALTLAASELERPGRFFDADATEGDEADGIGDLLAGPGARSDTRDGLSGMADLPLALGLHDLGEADATERDEAVHDDSRDEALTPSAAAPLSSTDAMPDRTAEAREPTGPGGGPSWATMGGVLALGALLVVLGGRALLRWGTPAATLPATSVTTTPAPAAVPVIVDAPEPVAGAIRESPPRDVNATPAPSPAVAAPSLPPPAARPAGTAVPAARAGPAAAAALPGRLLVRSTPSGAEVFLNGQRRGVSPLSIRDLPLGAYNVRLARAGFTPSQQRVVLEAGRPARALEVTLVRLAAVTASSRVRAAAAAGSLLVESRPAGARVLVDGGEAGRTPVTLPAVAAGDHAVRIELLGYLPISTSTRVEPGIRARVAVTLTTERPR